jgi:TM2 domain-containing membrane protein YozV
MPNCTNCGAEVGPEVSKCAYCGVAIATHGAHAPPHPPGYELSPMSASAGDERKNKVVAGMLGVLLGALGVHNFYLGYTTKGFIQLGLTLLSGSIDFDLGVGISALWGLVEGIMILAGSIATDARGRPLKG